MTNFELEARLSSINPQAFTDLKVVITGKLLELDREQAEIIVERAGGSVTGSVSGKTNLLVAGEKAGNKLTRARELGIEVIDEKEFLKRAFIACQGGPDKQIGRVELIAGGYGIDVVLSEINAELFLDIIDGTCNYNEYLSLSEGLNWTYSNSNPLEGDCKIEIVNTENGQVIQEFYVEENDPRINRTKKTIALPGTLYLLVTCNSREECWHRLRDIVAFDENMLCIEIEEVQLSDQDKEPWHFVQSIRYGADHWSESNDASKTWDYSFDLIDEAGALYSLDKYGHDDRTRMAIDNLAKLIDSKSNTLELTQGALFRRARLYLELGDPERAIADLDVLGRQLPEFSLSRLMLAKACNMVGESKKALAVLSGLIDEQLTTPADPSLIGQAYGERAATNISLNKNADAIADSKKAIEIMQEMKGYETELASYQFNLALLTERFTDNVATELFCTSITQVPARLKELEPFRIRRLLLSGRISYKSLISIVGDLLVGENLDYIENASSKEMLGESDHWLSPVNLSSLRSLYGEIEASKCWFNEYGIKSWSLSQHEGDDFIVLSGRNFKTVLHLLDGYIGLICGFNLVRLRGIENYPELHALLTADNAGLMSSIFRIEPNFGEICFERHIWTKGSPTRSNVFTQITGFVQTMEGVGINL